MGTRTSIVSVRTRVRAVLAPPLDRLTTTVRIDPCFDRSVPTPATATTGPFPPTHFYHPTPRNCHTMSPSHGGRCRGQNGHLVYPHLPPHLGLFKHRIPLSATSSSQTHTPKHILLLHFFDRLPLRLSMEELSSSASSVCSAYRHLSSSAAAMPPPRRRRGKVGTGGGVGLAGRCNAVLKEHKTRLYILGRCVSMLLCWHHHDSD
uniref:Uncharacterized protein n=1 Tax=Oryza punctata TaxID=4537 RepID=A0A0E0JEV3_ORYPU